MKDAFGPKSEQERLVFAIEEMRADVQLAIQEVMYVKGITRSDLARALGCSPANVTQLLAEDGNPTIETIARVFYALGDAAKFQSRFLEEEAARPGRVHAAEQQRMVGSWRVKGSGATNIRSHRPQATSESVLLVARDAARGHAADAHNQNALAADRYRPAA